jgi:Ca2+-binding RTX toxin-like protein
MMALLAPATARASTAWVNVVGGISIVGGSESSTISTDFGYGTAVVVKDSAGITPDAGSTCTYSSTTSVVCWTSTSNPGLEFDLGDGDDTIGWINAGHVAKAWGGAGNDTLRGDAENNLLYGQAGDDYLWGGQGADTLDGGPGTDQLIGDTIYAYEGGDGNDRIEARDGERDEVMCGGGEDTVIADANDDVYIECENVDRAGPPAVTPNPPPSTSNPPVSTSIPAISGRADAGATLTCAPGRWTGASSFAYQWLRDGKPATTGPTYRPAAADIGHTLACTVTATNAAGGAGATSTAVRVRDRTPPVVRSLKSSGRRGAMIWLRYQVRDNSGVMRDVITVYRGKRQLKRISTTFGRAAWSVGYHVSWRAPRTGSGFRFCVQSWDRAGNRSNKSCSPITLRR